MLCGKSDLEILKENHAKALTEVIKHLQDIRIETTKTQVEGVTYNCNLPNNYDTTNTSYITSKIVYNTQEARDAHWKYQQTLEPITNKLLYNDLKMSVFSGLVGKLFLIYQNRKGVVNYKYKKDVICASLLFPALQVFLGNLNKEEIKYLNDRTLTVHDDLYKNMSWYTAQRIIANIGFSGATMALTGFFYSLINK